MRRGLRYSLVLHVAVIAFLSFDFLNIVHKDFAPSEVPLIIDLTNIKVTEKTNLPPKVKAKKEAPKEEKKEPPKEEPKKPEPKFVPPKKPTPPPVQEEVKPEPIKDAAQLEEPKEEKPEVKKEPEKKEPPKKEAPKKVEPPKEKKKPAPKPKPKPKVSQKKAPKQKSKDDDSSDLKSLLASISKIEETIKERPEDAEAEPEESDEGVEGGSGGFLGRELTISDKDALASKIRQCWNFDAGAKGIESMIVEIRAYLNQDGSVRKVEILDTSRYNQDSFYRSVAESARRAVFICSPYDMLAERYPEKYDDWSTLFLRFNPMDGGVF